MRSAALLPTGTTMNPSKPETAEYFDPSQTAIIVTKDGSADPKDLRVLTTFGDPGAAWGIGTHHEIHHDQTRRYLGTFTVVGTRNFSQDLLGGIGNVPDRKIKHWVFK